MSVTQNLGSLIIQNVFLINTDQTSDMLFSGMCAGNPTR